MTVHHIADCDVIQQEIPCLHNSERVIALEKLQTVNTQSWDVFYIKDKGHSMTNKFLQ